VTKIEKLFNADLEDKFLTAKMELMSGAAESNTQQVNPKAQTLKPKPYTLKPKP